MEKCHWPLIWGWIGTNVHMWSYQGPLCVCFCVWETCAFSNTPSSLVRSVSSVWTWSTTSTCPPPQTSPHTFCLYQPGADEMQIKRFVKIIMHVHSSPHIIKNNKHTKICLCHTVIYRCQKNQNERAWNRRLLCLQYCCLQPLENLLHTRHCTSSAEEVYQMKSLWGKLKDRQMFQCCLLYFIIILCSPTQATVIL